MNPFYRLTTTTRRGLCLLGALTLSVGTHAEPHGLPVERRVTARPGTGGEVLEAAADCAPGAPSVAGASFCAGQALPVTFSANGGCTGGWTVQLSNAFGSFANPTSLGAAQPGTTSLPLPPGLAPGTGYRVRVVGGGRTSAAGAPFRVGGPNLSGVAPVVAGVPVCRGGRLTVRFSLPTGGCPFGEGNQFVAQLSSALGSFARPVGLGLVVPGQATALRLPAGASAGTGYRVRVVSTRPGLASGSSGVFSVREGAGCEVLGGPEEGVPVWAGTGSDSVFCQGSGFPVSAAYTGTQPGNFSDGGVGGSFTDVQAVNGLATAQYTPPANYVGAVTIRYDGGGSWTGSVRVRMSAPVSIVSMTPSRDVCPEAGPVALAVEATGEGLTYAWYRAGEAADQPVAGASGATLAVPPPAPNDSATYYVLVQGRYCPARVSPKTTLKALSPTTLSLTSGNTWACQGGNLTLTVAGSGPGTLSYEWKNPNGTVVGSSASITLTGVDYYRDRGTWVATARGTCQGSLDVRVAVRTQINSVSIEGENKFCPGQLNRYEFGPVFEFDPELSFNPDDEPWTYQWYANGQAIPGQVNQELLANDIPNLGVTNQLVVSVTNVCGSVTSEPFPFDENCPDARLATPDQARETPPRLVVAPNPATGAEIRGRITGMDNPAFILTTATGRSVGVSEKTDGSGEFVLTPKQRLAPGVYLLQASGRRSAEGQTRLTTRVLVVE